MYTPGDTSELVGCLERLLSDPVLCRRLGANAREAARARFTPNAVARETVAVYRTLLGQPVAA